VKIAIYHNQLFGGALRPLAAYLAAYRRQHRFDLYTTSFAHTGRIDLGRYADQVAITPVPGGGSLPARYRRLLAAPRYGREIAGKIDAGGYDVVFANLSAVTQAPEILPFLKTPNLYYCTEPWREFHEPNPWPDPATAKARLKSALLRPYWRSFRRFEQRSVAAATEIFTHSHYIADYIERVFGRSASVVHLGVDTELFRPLRRAREGFVLSVGALHPVKGHQFVIESIATIPAGLRPPLVILTGRGDWTARLTELARTRGVDLTFRHGLSDADVVELYNRAALMAAGQYGEPFGLITLEAMATGTPVVAVREGGLVETVTDGKTGLLTDRDPAAFGEAISHLLTRPDLARRLGRSGRTEARTHWQWQTATRKIDRLLKTVAEAR
jgi:glycosyltransferase involved in cell wall biosynthesis